MNQQRFPALTRALIGMPSRREVLRGLAGAGLGSVSVRHQDAAEAKKKRKHKTKKPQPNAFGCLDVGQPCAGNSATCCSGICDGVKPRKGKKDTSRCVGHDAGICKAGSDLCTTGVLHLCSANVNCLCLTTTGNAGFCGDVTDGGDKLCRDCDRDTDCEEEFGPGAACVVFEGACEEICASTGRTACMPPCA